MESLPLSLEIALQELLSSGIGAPRASRPEIFGLARRSSTRLFTAKLRSGERAEP